MDLIQETEEGQPHDRRNAVQAANETALAQHPGNIAILLQMFSRRFEISPEEQCSGNGGGHDFGICHLALRVFGMMQGFQHIVTQAKYCYNLAVYAILRYRLGLVTVNFTRFRMDFLMPLLGGNLG